MTTVKTTSGDYTITVDGGTGTLTVNADLDVMGNITYVEQLNVNDPFIVIAGNNTGTVTNMGIIAQKTLSTFAGLRYNTSVDQWQISTSVTVDGDGTYGNIVAGNIAISGANTQIQFNDSGVFGAVPNLAFDKVINKLTLGGHQVYGNIGATPTAVADSVIAYHKPAGSGGTGLYVKSLTIEDELVSKTKAIVFGIIF